MYEENGQYKGLDLEIFEGFCKARGHSYKITAYDWQGMLGAVMAGQADIAFSGYRSPTNARRSWTSRVPIWKTPGTWSA
jgi:ABC-type amino acid transport substrate-binding protein